MSYSEIIDCCRKGNVGLIPGWKGYLKWNYSNNQIMFVNGDYVLDQSELEKKIGDRNDLYYII